MIYTLVTKVCLVEIYLVSVMIIDYRDFAFMLYLYSFQIAKSPKPTIKLQTD